jgi:hypothetical protein
MKRLLGSLLLLFAFSLGAQAPVAVPITNEPHHHLVLENDYVRVFRVSVPAHDATLLHQHDVPYLYVSLGRADVINAIQGKPEARLVMADGQVGYSPGHFAHIARNESNSSFENVTIELLHPQGVAQNLCAQVISGQPVIDCGITAAERRNVYFQEPQFQTAELAADFIQLRPSERPERPITQSRTLLVVLNNSELQVTIAGQPAKSLRGGEVLWVEAGSQETLVNPGKNPAKYLQLSFRDSGTAAKP